MLREIPFVDLQSWMAYDELEPIGGLRGDWQAASVCSAVMNAMAIQSGSSKRFRVQDWLLTFGNERPKVEVQAPVKTWQEMKMVAQMWCAVSKAPSKKKWKR